MRENCTYSLSGGRWPAHKRATSDPTPMNQPNKGEQSSAEVGEGRARIKENIGRSSTSPTPHQALDALAVGIQTKRVNWVLDADIRAFFDNLSHEWAIKFMEHRVADRRILRLIQKWLKAGVSEDGQWSESNVGTPQGAVVSPLLANVYLHYVFDLWIEAWRKKVAVGEMIVVRYADDLVVGFESRAEAERFLSEFRERLAKFGLELHAEKTRLIEFGQFAERNGSGGQFALGPPAHCPRLSWSLAALR